MKLHGLFFRKMLFAASLLLLCAAESCTRRGEPSASVAGLPPIFPDYCDVTVPPNVAPLNFEVAGATHVRATFTAPSGKVFTVDGRDEIVIPLKRWRALLSESVGGALSVEVSVWTDDRPDGLRYKPFTIAVAADDIDQWLAYRLIQASYEDWDRMGIYQRDLTSFDVKTIVNSELTHRCVNCHAFAGYSPDAFMMHVRGAGGGTVIYKDGRLEKLQLQTLPPGKNGSYNFWHPSGRYIAFSSNQTRQSFYTHSQDKIEVFDLESDMLVYDVEGHRMIADERFLDSLSWETLPSFSPDGKYLYFSTSRPARMPVEYDRLHYSICRVAFDEATGALSSEVDTVYNAERDGGTALFPRFTPDGRYMLFSWAENGAFTMYHKEADLRMMDLTDGSYVDTAPLNSDDVESYHAWSSTGRWVVFSSKRIGGRYTRLFLAHWDGQRFAKPFMLPQRHASQNTASPYSYNIPEFITSPLALPTEQVARLYKKPKTE